MLLSTITYLAPAMLVKPLSRLLLVLLPSLRQQKERRKKILISSAQVMKKKMLRLKGSRPSALPLTMPARRTNLRRLQNLL